MTTIRFSLAALALTASTAFAQPETFKLYTQPNTQPDPMCDIFTRLTLDVDGARGTAELSDHVGGACEIVAEPNPRSYKLTAKSTACNSVVYEDASGKIRLTDHRLRTCDDLTEAKIIAEEQTDHGPLKLYSYDR